jgi:hypothetical protein
MSRYVLPSQYEIPHDQLFRALHVVECYHEHGNEPVTRFRNDDNGIHVIVTSDPTLKAKIEKLIQEDPNTRIRETEDL